jgi:hypothetical protein
MCWETRPQAALQRWRGIAPRQIRNAEFCKDILDPFCVLPRQRTARPETSQVQN